MAGGIRRRNIGGIRRLSANAGMELSEQTIQSYGQTLPVQYALYSFPVGERN